MRKKKNIILGVTASIAIYKACELVRKLCSDNFCINVVMTKNAEALVSPRVFASLIDGRVYCQGYNNVSLYERDIKHVALAEWADLVLIAPATANIIGKIASGIADDLLTTIILAVRTPILLAPSMNVNMYKNKIVQANIQKLKRLGFKFIGPAEGRLASGKGGLGRLVEVGMIVKAVRECI